MANVSELSTIGRTDYLVRGRSRLDVGHGVRDWEISFKDLATGRNASGHASALRARPALAAEFVSALCAIASSAAAARSTFTLFRCHLYRFWKFLDEMEDVSATGEKSFHAPTSVFAIPGTIWTLFKDWLAGGTTEAHLTYYVCKRVIEMAAQLLWPGDRSQFGFPLPPNPFPNPQKAAVRSSARQNHFLDPETARAVAAVLFARVQRTHDRISTQRAAMAEQTSIRSRALREVWELGQQHCWQLRLRQEITARSELLRGWMV